MEKFLADQAHFKYLYNKGYTSIEIAEELIHNMLESMKNACKNKNPNASDQEIYIMMKEMMKIDEAIKEKRRELRNKRIKGYN